MQELNPPPPIRVGAAEFSLPTNWRWSRDSKRLTVWKPCATMLCKAAQASFNLQETDLPGDVWQHAPTKVLRAVCYGTDKRNYRWQIRTSAVR